MDSRRFDNWTRNRALRLSRRDALRLAGASAGAAALAAHVPDTTAATTCTLTLHGEILGGPSQPTSYEGPLTFTIGANGVISQGAFTPAGGPPASVAGSLTGRAVDLQIILGNDRILALVGAAVRTGTACPTFAAGVLSGPDAGDLGAWQAAGNATTVPPSNPAQPTSTPTTPSGSSCIAPSFPCGPNCCPAGTTCTDTNQGICGCPGATTQCGNSCVPNCPNGQTLDLDRCTCASTCTPDQLSCTSSDQCCSGFCDPVSAICQTCQFLGCEGVGCVDPSIDPNNCGGCGVVCSAPTASCTDGACACQVDGLPCTTHSDCCSDSCLSSGVCGCATIGTDCSSFHTTCCDNGVTTACVFDTCRWLDNRHACFSDNECLTGICSNGACASCLDPGEGPCTRDAECCNYNGLGCVNGMCPQ